MSELDKPSRNEDEYFVRLDAELLKQRRAELDAQRAATNAATPPQCPHGHGDLTQRELESVIVDICPECGGMWLDAGELDLIRDAQRSGLSRFVDGIFGKGR
ncbi:MAG TPA: zf-TFIIB domain-containing protein [Gemmatimonadales bacterium]